MINTELFMKVAEQIEKEPDSYDQYVWVDPTDEMCGTKACIAGHALLLSGEATLVCGSYCGKPYVTIAMKQTLEEAGYEETVPWKMGNTIFELPFVHTDLTLDHSVDGENPFIEEAARILGLGYDEAAILFSSYWMPAAGLTVSEALVKIANGAKVDSVTHEEFFA